MVALNGWFFSTDLTNTNTPNKPISSITSLDVAGLNFGLVLHEDTEPLIERYTTWGINAESSTVYQSLGKKNQVIIGDAGNIYVLEEEAHNDNGQLISVLCTSAPYPLTGDQTVITSYKRTHNIFWQTRTAPPTGGQRIQLSLINIDNFNNVVHVPILQLSTKVNVRAVLEARQWYVQWALATNQDYDILSVGFIYQLIHRPYTGY